MTKSTQGSYKANLIRYDCSGQSAAQSVIVRLRTLRDFGEFEMAYSCARFSLCYNHWWTFQAWSLNLDVNSGGFLSWYIPSWSKR